MLDREAKACIQGPRRGRGWGGGGAGFPHFLKKKINKIKN